MALTGVLRPGFVQLRVLDMPESIDYYTKRIGLHQVAEGPDGRVYLKSADEFDHHSIVLRRADHAGVDLMAFKVLEDADLDKFEVVAINIDTGDDTKPKKFLEEIGVRSLGFYRDASMALFNEAKQRGLALGLPVTLLVDGEGCLIGHMNGPAEWASPDARKLVEAALGS